MGSFVGILMATMFLIVPILVVTIIVVAIVRKNKEGDLSENFEKIVRTIYVYILLIGFLFMVVGSVVFAVQSAVNYYIPNSQISEITKSSVYPLTQR